MKVFSSQIHRTFTEQKMNVRSSHQRSSVKKVFLEISQSSQENTCARGSVLIKLQSTGSQQSTVICNQQSTGLIKSLAQVFSFEFCEISKSTFFTEHLWTNASGVFQVIGFLKKIDSSSTDKFLSPIPFFYWLIFCCRNLIPYYRYTNAGLKIFPNVCVPMKIMPWEFNHRNC